MQLDWLTDPHLDHLPNEKALIKFVKGLNARPSDGLLLTGDIAESATIPQFLEILSGAYRRPVYFVLGNHDYYGGWMVETQERVKEMCVAVPEGILNYMPDAGVVMLSKRTAIVGHDGMYDGREGKPGLKFAMSDFFLPSGISDFVEAFSWGSRHLFDKLRELGEESAAHVKETVREARLQGARRILILTHVPPFLEASYFRGRPSEPGSAPFYVNRSLGDALLELAEQNPKIVMEVFAGHTHGRRVYQARDNLVVRVGSARYGRQPKYQEPITV
jgi:predicted phosphodiesterase